MTDDDVETISDVFVKQETTKALLVVVDERQVWVPKSVIHDDSEVFEAGTSGKLIVARWFAEKEGLEP